MIPYGKQDITQEDIDSVLNVLTSDFLTQGPKVPEFESAIAQYVGAKHAIAVNSATSALHIACMALGVDEHSWVWTSPLTFVASANCARLCGAKVDFVDVDPATGNMCPKALELKLAHAASIGKLPKVIIPVHLAGHSCDMQAIQQVASQYDIAIIEDASHAIGSRYHDKHVGCCQFSDICVFSFHPVKIVTTAEGGVLTTQNSNLASKLKSMRSHGIDKNCRQLLRPDEGDWYYEQHELGLNYRMSDIHAALGVSQLARLDNYTAKRNELAKQYQQRLSKLPLDTIEPLSNSYSARHLLLIKLHNPTKRKQVFNAMRQANIQVHVHYFPVHLQPYYLAQGFSEGDAPQAEALYNQLLSLPLYPELTPTQVDYICDTLEALL
ncbi:UDP-4-amino-4,6-dideoxy-N-acetyl-beta-L-altrosamine transaminase [Shewanella sp. WXL01]|uniref:UDP-4-amino-4, 6-dideoxy-N-acetyl-beta-L-altrosamine transaminase n=1 Tax=Shewanella sp. WXL01 TaxID=2709721 RepID=UPI0014384E9A|nr:UDP-4-amino-4,6-dideoxy-N-acetyl-beta-L-altrosamine transaminase [Shewanella sp. WXL01]NKF51056.1 UDP-4-amino-4,6-dideoxy-N-acetyl-beta-L-altrosamine transaminase [Shewanella sp. WXL01]